MESKDDKILKDFFGEHKQVIADNGFSDRVMRQLPKNQRRADWIVTVFTFVGMVITFLLVDIREVIVRIFTSLSGVPFYYIAGAFMLLPLITLAVLFCIEKEKIFD